MDSNRLRNCLVTREHALSAIRDDQNMLWCSLIFLTRHSYLLLTFNLYNILIFLHISEANTEYFSWVTGEDTSGIHGFTPIGDSKNHLQRIKIKQQGVYIIYAQVAINGRKSP